MRGISVDIEKTVGPGGRAFRLKAKFSSGEDFVVLFGPSGSGKSMTLKCIAGLLAPDKGEISLCGRTLFDSDKKVDVPIRGRMVGYTFQDYALFPHLNVEENIGFGLRKRWGRGLGDCDMERVRELVEMFGLGPVAKSLPSNISGGQRQRTALARALAKRPCALLLDEPFSALDQTLKGRMRAELKAVQRRFDMPVVLVTHDPADVEAFGGTVVEFNVGETLREAAAFNRFSPLPGPAFRF